MSSPANRPLLVLDGDSLAHRAYHALPKSFRRAEGRPGNALLGFSNFLLRLWQSEQPRAVVVGWDSLDTPTYRHELFAGYQAGREFDDDLLEQPDRMPGARGVGPKTAASLLAQYGSLEAMLADGRFAAQSEELRMYRRMATLDASAPLPPLRNQTPKWAEASAFVRELGLNALADRVAALSKS